MVLLAWLCSGGYGTWGDRLTLSGVRKACSMNHNFRAQSILMVFGKMQIFSPFFWGGGVWWHHPYFLEETGVWVIFISKALEKKKKLTVKKQIIHARERKLSQTSYNPHIHWVPEKRKWDQLGLHLGIYIQTVMTASEGGGGVPPWVEF